MYQAKSGVKNFSLYWGGGSLNKKFFSQSEHVSSQIWYQKFFPLLVGGVPRQKVFSGLSMYQAKSGVKNFSLFWDQVPPWKSETWYPPPKNLRPGTPPQKKLRPGTPPPSRCELTNKLKTVPSPILRMRAVNIKYIIDIGFSSKSWRLVDKESYRNRSSQKFWRKSTLLWLIVYLCYVIIHGWQPLVTRSTGEQRWLH